MVLLVFLVIYGIVCFLVILLLFVFLVIYGIVGFVSNLWYC